MKEFFSQALDVLDLYNNKLTLNFFIYTIIENDFFYNNHFYIDQPTVMQRKLA